jgi:cytochrome c biogenesis protein CcmG/thiol:disulfide interchange protein DsbE
MKSSAVRIFASLFVLVLAFAGCETSESDPASVVVGSEAPTFSLTSLDGTTVKSSALKGHVVVLNFWATWCQPCMGEIPELKQVAAGSKAKVIGIALDQDGAKTIRPFVVSNNINYTVLVGDEEVFQRFNGIGIPYTLLLDPSQRIVKIYRGPTTKEIIERDLNSIGQTAQLGSLRRSGSQAAD